MTTGTTTRGDFNSKRDILPLGPSRPGVEPCQVLGVKTGEACREGGAGSAVRPVGCPGGGSGASFGVGGDVVADVRPWHGTADGAGASSDGDRHAACRCRLRCRPEVCAATYYTSLLTWVGCATDTSELAELFGDETHLYEDSHDGDLHGALMALFMAKHLGYGSSRACAASAWSASSWLPPAATCSR